MMTSVPFARLAVAQGSIVIYDSRTLHRGAANTSPFARPTIYFSLAESQKLIPIGPAYSLRQGYRQFPITIETVLAGNIPEEVLADGVLVHSDERCLEQLEQLCPLKRRGAGLSKLEVLLLERRASEEALATECT